MPKFLIQHRRRENTAKSGGLTPRILNLGIRLRCGEFHAATTSPPKKNLPVPTEF
jgi:hypothetical protein